MRFAKYTICIHGRIGPGFFSLSLTKLLPHLVSPVGRQLFCLKKMGNKKPANHSPVFVLGCCFHFFQSGLQDGYFFFLPGCPLLGFGSLLLLDVRYVNTGLFGHLIHTVC